jgi:hypothetical protein
MRRRELVVGALLVGSAMLAGCYSISVEDPRAPYPRAEAAAPPTGADAGVDAYDAADTGDSAEVDD